MGIYRSREKIKATRIVEIRPGENKRINLLLEDHREISVDNSKEGRGAPPHAFFELMLGHYYVEKTTGSMEVHGSFIDPGNLNQNYEKLQD